MRTVNLSGVVTSDHSQGRHTRKACLHYLRERILTDKRFDAVLAIQDELAGLVWHGCVYTP